MTCGERKDLMLLYATDSLDESERAELRAHLATGCPQCAGALAEAQATVALLPQVLPKVEAPAAARDRLMTRVLAGRPQQSATGSIAAISPSANMSAPVRRAGGLSRLAIAACLGALLSGLIVWSKMSSQFNPSSSPDLEFVSLKGTDPQPQARGRIFWDRDKNDWHVQVFDLKPPPPGRTYELWFITPEQKKVRGGEFVVDRKGHATFVVAVPRDLGKIAVAAITDEPMGGVNQPTKEGHAHLVGNVQ